MGSDTENSGPCRLPVSPLMRFALLEQNIRKTTKYSKIILFSEQKRNKFRAEEEKIKIFAAAPRKAMN